MQKLLMAMFSYFELLHYGSLTLKWAISFTSWFEKVDISDFDVFGVCLNCLVESAEIMEQMFLYAMHQFCLCILAFSLNSLVKIIIIHYKYPLWR